MVFLKVSPMKGVMRFWIMGKLNPRYVSPYVVLRRVGNVSYKLDLPSSLSFIHPVFHVSMLRKCMGDPPQIVPIKDIDILNFFIL